MGRFRWVWPGIGVVALAFLGMVGEIAAQLPGSGLPQPQILTVFPSGGRIGSEVTVLLSGAYLEDAESLWFSDSRMRAERLPESAGPPLSAANPQYQQLQRNRRGQNAPTSRVRFRVTIPADVPLGLHDLRVVSPLGVSNPRAFLVGDQPERTEFEPNDDVDQAQRIELNSVVHGEVPSPLDVDFFVLKGTKGQRVVVSGLTTSIDHRLDLAVGLYEESGRLLAANQTPRDGEVLIDATLPADGDYYLRLHQFTYTRGGFDQAYRLSVSTAPWIDAVSPPVVEPGRPTMITIWGRNLPDGRTDPRSTLDGVVLERAEISVTPPSEPQSATALRFSGATWPAMSSLDGFDFRVRNRKGWSNPVLLSFAQGPVVLDAGTNDNPEQAQAVSPPCEIAGRVESRGDRDWYTFDAKKGEVLSIEAWGDRLGAPLDLYLLLRSPDGKQTLFEVDETPPIPNSGQFYVQTNDPPRQRFVVPSDGRYTLLISAREASARTDPRFVYRLRIGPEQPDFRLVAMPQSPFAPDANVLRPGSRVDFAVFAWRLDGFADEIELSVDGLPPGIACAPAIIGPGVWQGSLVLSASDDAAAWTGPISIRGTARIDGREVTRQARSASIVWPSLPQPNFPSLARLDHGPVLAVRPGDLPFTLEASTNEIQAVQGTRVEVGLKLQKRWKDFQASVQVASLGLPPNLTFQRVTIAGTTTEAKTTLSLPTSTPPGEYDVVFQGQAIFPYSPEPKASQKPNIQVFLPSHPVRLLVVPKELARLSIEPGTPTVKAGADTEITVRLDRQFGFGGEFRIELVAPKDVKGLSAEPVTVPTGQDEAKLVLKTEADTPPGNRSNLLVRVTATFREGAAPTVQETKLGVNVTK
jgi:hypothetical protein